MELKDKLALGVAVLNRIARHELGSGPRQPREPVEGTWACGHKEMVYNRRWLKVMPQHLCSKCRTQAQGR